MNDEELTVDRFLGGRLALTQPRRGHRAGSDAALLAAAARSLMPEGATVVDLGAGCGQVGLALALAGAKRVALVEIDPRLAEIAQANASANALADRATAVCADVACLALEAGPDWPGPQSADIVVSNPPFDHESRFRSSAAKAVAHQAPRDLAEIWSRAAARLARPGGAFVLIHRPEALADLLAALDGRFGDLRIRPVHPRAETPAGRILISARKGARGALRLLPGFVMHDGAGFSPEADAAQRGDAAIDMA